jgi:hypothetical protein
MPIFELSVTRTQSADDEKRVSHLFVSQARRQPVFKQFFALSGAGEGI